MSPHLPADEFVPPAETSNPYYAAIRNPLRAVKKSYPLQSVLIPRMGRTFVELIAALICEDVPQLSIPFPPDEQVVVSPPLHVSHQNEECDP